MEFADRLKYEREKRHLSQQDVAKELLISRQTLSKWELGKSYPDLEMVLLLSKFYNFSIDEVFSKNPPRKITPNFIETISKMDSEAIIEILILGVGLPLIIFAIFF